VHSRTAPLKLIYVDDVVDLILSSIKSIKDGKQLPEIDKVYETTVGEVSDIIVGFGNYSEILELGAVGNGLKRDLYSTYVSFLPPTKFATQIKKHSDHRGDFVEILRTPDCGQFSYFTAHPGVTRGGHYHHSKTEKFLVIQGKAKFKFRNLLTEERFEIDTDSEYATVVDTIPGWVHDITNVGNDKLIVALWANEKFDRERPDTFSAEV
jgi:UDP-2-acetamido-2,6-beta-L-arabino-hexul-4-ose reductase